MQHLNDTDKKLIPCIDTLKRNQKMTYLTYTGLCKVLTKSRKPNILQIANDFGINLLRQINTCIEAEILNNIKISFNNENSIDQYTIDNYRIDLYFPDYKLAIECDEDGHNIVLDELREQYIKDKIGCKFIRFKPYTKDFNVFQLINQIHQFIVLSL
jgi:very-short-patch-repair endonuclease